MKGGLSPGGRANSDFQQSPDKLKVLVKQMQARVPSLDLGTRRLSLPAETWTRVRTHWEEIRRSLTPKLDDGKGFLMTSQQRALPTLFHQDRRFNDALLEELRPMHEAWYGAPLVGSACYGIRVYLPGAYLYTHVDTSETHVVSSTLCVAKKLDLNWPLWIREGESVNEVELEPGELLHYEGAALEHGRPYPLVGEYYAGIFLHYRPLDWDLFVED